MMNNDGDICIFEDSPDVLQNRQPDRQQDSSSPRRLALSDRLTSTQIYSTGKSCQPDLAAARTTSFNLRRSGLPVPRIGRGTERPGSACSEQGSCTTKMSPLAVTF